MTTIPILIPEDGTDDDKITIPSHPGAKATNKPEKESISENIVYGTLILAHIGEVCPDYWIKCVESDKFGGRAVYVVYKGFYPNEDYQIMTCIRPPVPGRCMIGNQLEFYRDETELAKLIRKPGYQSPTRTAYTLTNQTEELGTVYKYHDEKNKLDFAPHLKLRFYDTPSNFTRYCMIITMIISMVLVLGILVPLLSTARFVIWILLGFILVSFVLFILQICFAPLCQPGDVIREVGPEVTGLESDEVYADLYFLKGAFCKHCDDIELYCFKSLTMPQLMGLVSMAILNSKKWKREVR